MSNLLVEPPIPFVDIHCHLLPGIDDGATSWDVSLEMARMAVAGGIGTVIVTPHQLGMFNENRGQMVRERTTELQRRIQQADIPLRVMPGADVRIEPELIDGLRSGDTLSLADHGRHVLLELPHELYFPLEPVLDSLQRINMIAILSHPERNQGLLSQPRITAMLAERGCLMQVTCGSLLGRFGTQSQTMSEWMIRKGLVHFLATDAHGVKSRRPQMRRAFQRAVELASSAIAVEICCRNPAAVADGNDVAIRSCKQPHASTHSFRRRKSA